MYSQNILEKYAKLAVTMGLNIQKGQPVVIRCTVDSLKFAKLCQVEAYKAGASIVRIDFRDSEIDRNDFTYQSIETLSVFPDYKVFTENWFVERGCCYLSISSANPDALKGIDSEKLKAANAASGKKMKKIHEYTMSNKGQWCVIGYPSLTWAKKAFPNDSDEVALEKLEKGILQCIRVSEDNDPIQEWAKHNKMIKERSAKLNSMKLVELHYTNDLGTDLTIKLPKGHLWEGGYEHTSNGLNVAFNPNMPTEEIFTLPQKDGVNGKVVSTKPLVYMGNLIKDFWIEFKDGKAINYDAKEGKEALSILINADAGSCYLGEVALVPYDSPISNSGILFYSTLFDENASCHLALGAAYPTSIENGINMSDEEFAAAGGNISFEHSDFMVGSKDLNIEGTCEDGTKVQIFKNGNFVF